MKMRSLIAFIATCGGVGYAPVAPGTMGSLAAFAAYWVTQLYRFPFFVQAGIVAIVSIVGVMVATLESRAQQQKDPRSIVIDEWAAVWLVCMILPHAILPQFMGLAIFRLLDITKVGPVAWAERLPEGLGIMADDLAAAALSAVFVQLVFLGQLSLS